MMYHSKNIAVLPAIKSMTEVFDIDLIVFLKALLAIILICKPSNITIKMILAVYKPGEKEVQKSSTKQAGRLIGTLERLIMLTLISIGEYSAIGFVLTAKSIARYSKISDEPEFAEYYLVGTLLSMLAVLCTYQIIILL